jgi:hypothetical protein
MKWNGLSPRRVDNALTQHVAKDSSTHFDPDPPHENEVFDQEKRDSAEDTPIEASVKSSFDSVTWVAHLGL